MHTLRAARLTLAIWMLALACSSGARTSDAPQELPFVTLPPEVDRVLRDYERAWKANDATALSKLFAEDGFVLAHGKPPVRGRANVERAYAGQGGALALAALAYSATDTVGYIIGVFGGSDPYHARGKFVLALKRTAGGPWMIAADIDNPIR